MYPAWQFCERTVWFYQVRDTSVRECICGIFVSISSCLISPRYTLSLAVLDLPTNMSINYVKYMSYFILWLFKFIVCYISQSISVQQVECLFNTYPHEGCRCAAAYPQLTGREAGRTLDCSPTNHRAHLDKQPETIHTYGQFKIFT